MAERERERADALAGFLADGDDLDRVVRAGYRAAFVAAFAVALVGLALAWVAPEPVQ